MDFRTFTDALNANNVIMSVDTATKVYDTLFPATFASAGTIVRGIELVSTPEVQNDIEFELYWLASSSDVVRAFAAEGRRVMAIKAIRDLWKARHGSLPNLKPAVDALKSVYPVGAPVPFKPPLS